MFIPGTPNNKKKNAPHVGSPLSEHTTPTPNQANAVQFSAARTQPAALRERDSEKERERGTERKENMSLNQLRTGKAVRDAVVKLAKAYEGPIKVQQSLFALSIGSNTVSHPSHPFFLLE